ncbi:hypothetical protein BJ875DRAFT_526721 [Amylocarpus encephaloides]|uniref:Nudix hydrolase domain-containing protein n=1 Tax=Amylocarpus encephaloides TaxID=45428 RepID=A0A9P7Y786_9HELO|nr:hypothetical protein BJ875DRAFT_526721 [Amylocarpus encephaloides]
MSDLYENKVPCRFIGKQDATVTYTNRTCIHAILYSPLTSEIAILKDNNGNYFKLPGCDVQEKEPSAVALTREILEETHCKAVIDDEYFAKSEQWKGNVHQVSFCYVAKLVKDTGKANLGKSGLAGRLWCHWLTVEEALELMKRIEPTSKLDSSIKERDSFFVKTFANVP